MCIRDSSKPVLAVFGREKPIIIYADAIGVGIGAVLKQRQTEGCGKPVAYLSKKLCEARTKKTSIYMKALAIGEVVKYWRYLLLGKKFTIITHHEPLENFNYLTW